MGLLLTAMAVAPLLLSWALTGAAALPTPASPAPLRPKPGQRHLMIDDALLEPQTPAGELSRAASGAVPPVLRMHPAQKTGQVVIKPDKAWEGVIFYYDSVVQVSKSEFRIYYE